MFVPKNELEDFALTRVTLLAAIDALPPRQREAFILWHDGYTQEEIAARMGIAQQTVCEHIASAQATLRESIG